jgi:hypothetical protein
MKPPIAKAAFVALLTLSAAATTHAGVKSQVPVQPLTSTTTPTQIEVNATAARELSTKDDLSWIWFGGKVTNPTSKPIRFKLEIFFVDGNGSELGSETLSGYVAAGASTTVPETRTVMETSAVRQVFGARYVLTFR